MGTATGFYHKLPNGKGVLVKIKQGGLIHWFTPKRMIATTIRRTIYVRKGRTLTDSSLQHELVHVDQWYREGIIKFLFKYFYYQIRYGYDKNPLEQEAREKSGQPTR